MTRRTGRNGGLAPRLRAVDRALLAEILAAKRESSPEEQRRYPRNCDIAARWNVCPGVLYRIASGRKPYRRINPRDRVPNNVPYGTCAPVEQLL